MRTLADHAPTSTNTSTSSRDRREPGEFADEVPKLYRLASLDRSDPERARLREQLILRFLPVGERLAARHSGSSPWAREDLRQVAYEAVVRAIDRWDSERARGDFLGYLVPCVRGEILRYFRDQSWSLRVPRRLKELSVAIKRAHAPLAQRLGRTPRPSDFARHLGADLEEVLEALRAEDNHHTASLESEGHDDEPALVDRLGTDDHRLELAEDLHVLRPLLDRLPARERRILLLRFYGGRTQSQIAEEIGISQMHVSRLLSRTLAELRQGMLGAPTA